MNQVAEAEPPLFSLSVFSGHLVTLVCLDGLAAQGHVADALPGGRTWLDGVIHAAHTHHVAALLVVGIGVEQIIGHVFQDGLDHRSFHLRQRALRIGNRGLVHQLFHADGVAGQQTGAPAEAW